MLDLLAASFSSEACVAPRFPSQYPQLASSIAASARLSAPRTLCRWLLGKIKCDTCIQNALHLSIHERGSYASICRESSRLTLLMLFLLLMLPVVVDVVVDVAAGMLLLRMMMRMMLMMAL